MIVNTVSKNKTVEPAGVKFAAEEANSTISNTITGLEYSTDGAIWQDYSGETLTLANIGDEVYFKTKAAKSGNSPIGSFTMSGKIAASGNIQYLIDPTGESLEVFDYCYYNMFAGCEGLVKAPELPATTLAPLCYSGMFSECVNFAQAPTLPATTLADFCYEYMFGGCVGLTQAPILPATTLAPYCYSKMFGYCSSLKSITVNFLQWDGAIGATNNWVEETYSGTGTFLCPSGLPTLFGNDNIPPNWSVQHF